MEAKGFWAAVQQALAACLDAACLTVFFAMRRVEVKAAPERRQFNCGSNRAFCRGLPKLAATNAESAKINPAFVSAFQHFSFCLPTSVPFAHFCGQRHCPRFRFAMGISWSPPDFSISAFSISVFQYLSSVFPSFKPQLSTIVETAAQGVSSQNWHR